jgi:CAAX protease family protein
LGYIVRSRVNLFYDEREQRVRAFWRVLFQLALYAGAIAFSRLVAPGIWVALYRRLVDAEAIVRPTSPTSLFVAVQVALVLVVLFSLWFSARLLDGRPLSQLGLHADREWWLDLSFGLFLGSLLMSAIFLIELAAGWVAVRGVLETTREGAPLLSGHPCPVGRVGLFRASRGVGLPGLPADQHGRRTELLAYWS